MGLSLVQSRALLGLAAPAVTVEVHLANGLPSFTNVKHYVHRPCCPVRTWSADTQEGGIGGEA